ncbi:MAG: SulP family inorganic anion transporter [Chitinophagaceae bacterium]
MLSYKNNFKSDILSGLIVFLVALPLCLGIALASGAPLFAGIISGVVGGIVVGFLSHSQLSVSGPAAGLTAIVLAAITSLGSYEAFLVAVVISGALQILFGFLKAGIISNYFPSNVIEGMLAAIGVIIILKQLPHAIGYDLDVEGDMDFIEPKTGHNTLTAIWDSIQHPHMGALTISIVCIIVLILFQKSALLKKMKFLPGGLVVVILGTCMNLFFNAFIPDMAISSEHLVNIPIANSIQEFISQQKVPDFSVIFSLPVWSTGLTIAVV